jgi:hypothetical protein
MGGAEERGEFLDRMNRIYGMGKGSGFCTAAALASGYKGLIVANRGLHATHPS